MITVTAKDALRTKELRPGWRDGEVKTYLPKVDSTGAALHVWEIEVMEEGFPLPVPLKPYQVSEKAISMGKNFFIACGFPQEEWDKLMRGESSSYQFDGKICVGKKLKVFVANREWEGRINNEATDFLAGN